MFETPEIFARIYARHGHRCPMSTLGGRLGLAAMKIVGAFAGRLHAVYSNRTCALDGIAETTGCSEDAGSLVVNNDGRHALSVTMGDEVFEVELTTEALEIAGRYRSLCTQLEKNWGELDVDEQARRRTEMEGMLDELLPQLWHAEDDFLIQRAAG